jgi:hypothetical protein
MFNAKHEFGDDIASRLDATICPGCGANLEAKAPACHECGYENGVDGYMLSVREIVEGNSYPEKGAITLNEVSPAFIRAVIRTAVGDSSK